MHLPVNSGRASQHPPNASTNRDRWMVSYMDVLTIVLMFFVGIAAQNLRHAEVTTAETPATTPEPLTAPTIPAATREASDPPPSENRQALLRVQETLEQPGVEMRMESEGLLISLPQAILFASGKERISRDALPVISRIADVLREIPNQVRLVGYADSVPIHTRKFKSNWDLASARSLTIQKLLKQSGIEDSRVSIASYGSNRPSSSNDTPDGRAQNRRVEILILDEDAVPIPSP